MDDGGALSLAVVCLKFDPLLLMPYKLGANPKQGGARSDWKIYERDS